MTDRMGASLILTAAGLALGVFWYRLTRQQRDALIQGLTGKRPTGGNTPPPTKGTSRGPFIGPPAPGADRRAEGSPLDRLLGFAAEMGLRVTSTTGGTHNPGSLHYEGRAIDVSARGLTDRAIDGLRDAAAAIGIRLRDERRRPPGQGVWGGPHIHLEVPR